MGPDPRDRARHSRENAAVRGGGWQQGVGMELAGSTLGILGLGRIGRRIAGYARAFDMNVVAWSANLRPDDARANGATWVGKDELFTVSDIVSVHLQLSDRTRGLIGARELDLLGPGGHLVNTSRGPIVDESALITALRERRIAGAALDVFDTEPLPPDHPLRTLPNTVVTPHIGYVSGPTYAAFYGEVVEDITRRGWTARRSGCSNDRFSGPRGWARSPLLGAAPDESLAHQVTRRAAHGRCGHSRRRRRHEHSERRPDV